MAYKSSLICLSLIGLTLVLTLELISGQETGTIVPLYIWPEENADGVHPWQKLIKAKEAYNITVWAIVNVNNGPGSARDDDYTKSIPMLTKKGINVMGYVRTNYTKRPAAQVRADIDNWLKFYPNYITGIFFDEMSNKNEGKSKRQSGYYKSLNDFAKGKPGIKFTVGNPGTDTSPDFVDTVDNIIIFETDTGFPGVKEYGGWHTRHPRSKWGILPYNIPSLDKAKVLDAKKYVQYIYVTDDKLDNPWDTLATYLNTLFEYLKA